MDALLFAMNAGSPLPLMGLAMVYFSVIYSGFACLVWIAAKIANRPIETKPLKAAQIQGELIYSLRSILLFAAGMCIPWAMIKFGIANIHHSASPEKIVLDCLILILWNDLHFYMLHRLLHVKLKRSHALHHKSVSATPFSAYSMSAVEAALLGSVMPVAMLFYDFSLASLVFLPVWSIFINTLAHSNCDFFPNAKENSLLYFIRHHQDHHSHYHGNYSFFFGQLDTWFRTNKTSD